MPFSHWAYNVDSTLNGVDSMSNQCLFLLGYKHQLFQLFQRRIKTFATPCFSSRDDKGLSKWGVLLKNMTELLPLKGVIVIPSRYMASKGCNGVVIMSLRRHVHAGYLYAIFEVYFLTHRQLHVAREYN